MILHSSPIFGAQNPGAAERFGGVADASLSMELSLFIWFLLS